MAGFLRGLALGAGAARAGQQRGRTQAEQLLAARREREQERSERTEDRAARRKAEILEHGIANERLGIERERLGHDKTRADADLLRAQAAGLPDPDKRNVTGERYDLYRRVYEREMKKPGMDSRRAARTAGEQSGHVPGMTAEEALMLMINSNKK